MGKRNSVKLVTILLRYAFLWVMLSIFCVLLWITMFNIAIKRGLILEANYSEIKTKESIVQIQKQGYFDPTLLPSYLEYAVFSNDGNLIETTLKGEGVEAAIHYYQTGYNSVQRYHMSCELSNITCVIQYRLRAMYAKESMNHSFPNCQKVLVVGLGSSLLGVFIALTTYFANKMKQHLKPLMLLSKQMADGNLEDTDVKAGIKEFDEVMNSMHYLRTALRDSLLDQWKMQENQKVQTAALVHDIKTPLTVISGNAQLLAETAQEEDEIYCTRSILRNVDAAQSYVDELRELTKSNTTWEIKKERVQGYDLIIEIEERAKQICRVRGIEFKFQRTTVPLLYVDKQAILRSILNIVDNACCYTKKNGCVEVLCVYENRELAIHVLDQGPGFSEHSIKHAKELFYTENENRNTSGHSGIGLAYANNIAKIHGGFLTLENDKKGHGNVKFVVRTEIEI